MIWSCGWFTAMRSTERLGAARAVSSKAGCIGRSRYPTRKRFIEVLGYNAKAAMLIDFFLKVKSHKLPVSIKEYLTLLEAMDKKVIGPSVDEFYYLSRIALVKDEANYDKFDRAFAEFWQGVETIPGIEAQIPLEWLVKKGGVTAGGEKKEKIQAPG